MDKGLDPQRELEGGLRISVAVLPDQQRCEEDLNLAKGSILQLHPRRSPGRLAHPSKSTPAISVA